MNRAKNNPMFISSTHGAYDFVDFTSNDQATTDQNDLLPTI